MDLELRGRLALVTGASQGIGAAIAEVLAREGCNLRLVARTTSDLEKLATRLSRDHEIDVQYRSFDLSGKRPAQELLDFAEGIDFLVNNAGAIPYGNLWDVDDPAWEAGWDLKLIGYMSLVRSFYPRMKARGGGVILNIIGNAGERYNFDYVFGTTANAALMAFTRAIGGRSMNDGVRVLAINPGPVETERVRQIYETRAAHDPDAGSVEALLSDFPAGRIATPGEIADAVAFLLSPRSAYSSGCIYTIDGGISSLGEY